MLGILTGAGLVPWLVTFYGGGRVGYASMSVGVAIACALAMAGPIVMLRGRDILGPRLTLRSRVVSTARFGERCETVHFSDWASRICCNCPRAARSLLPSPIS